MLQINEHLIVNALVVVYIELPTTEKVDMPNDGSGAAAGRIRLSLFQDKERTERRNNE